MTVLWYAIQVIIGYNLVLPFIWYIFFILKGKKDGAGFKQNILPDYAIIVTAFEEISHIPETISSILKLRYTNFICYVVLDNCKDISSLVFTDERVILLKPDKVLAGNVRSHFYAINNFKRQHTHLTIIDSDNLVDENYLDQLNKHFQLGYSAVQGIREPKNLNTEYAALDAARDIYYHFYDGLILYSLGASATLSGSGMAFTTDLYKDSLQQKDISGAGFDKVLQYEIVKQNIRIAFNDKAIVYDQKTSRSDQLVNQRSRWINTWFKYFSYGFLLIGKGIVNRSINQLLFGFTLLRPPLFIFLLLSLLFALIDIWFNPFLSIIWVVAILIFISGFVISLNYYKADSRIIKALKHIPKFVFYQLISVIFSGKANKRSVATKHFQ